MAQVDPQDRWGEVSSLSSFPEEPLKMTMALESEDEDGGEAEDQRGTGGPERQAHPRGSFQVAHNRHDMPWRQPPCQEEEDFSDSLSTRGMGKKPMAMPGRRASEGRDESKTTPTQDSPGARTAPGALPAGLSHKLLDQMQFPRDSVPAGNGGDLRTNLEAALGVPYSFPGPGRSFCTQSGVDTSRDNASPLCVPKPGTGRKGQSLVGAGGQGAPCPYKCLRGGWAFPCPTCSKCFTKSSNLMEHQTLHSGQRPFKCADCGMAFVQPSRLGRHQRIHTGQRPFPCAQCGQAFARSSTLKWHQQVHSGDKGFLCSQCSRTFRIASELAQHIRLHNGQRPYQCHDCGQAFTRSSHLQRHRAKHDTCKKEPIPSSSDE